MMKYSLNHDWKFVDWRISYLAGFLQTTAMLLIEIVNFVAMITHFELIDIVMKFMTLQVIMLFGSIFYTSYEEADWKKVITDKNYASFFRIQRTTSCYSRGV